MSSTWLAGRLRPESLISRTIYHTFLKFSGSYMATTMVAATALGLTFDMVTNAIWDANNKGKQWKEIGSKLVQEEDE